MGTFFQKLGEFFMHKKWLATLGVALGYISAWLTGEMALAEAMAQIAKVVIAAIVSQAGVDIATTVKKNGTG